MTKRRLPLISRVGNRLADRIRPWVVRHPTLRRNLRRVRAWLPPPNPPADVGRLVAVFGRAYPQAYFLQVGANDGALYDPLRREILRRNWHGIMIEPVPDVFERLAANYDGYSRIALENVAVAAEEGERPFYHLRRVADPRAENLPVWYGALGSFHKEVILSHRDLIPDIEGRLVTRNVQCRTINSLCDKHGVVRADLIQIDTEGHDYEVIKLIDFDRLKPRLVLYEHHHLSDSDRLACQAHLARFGFETIERHYDTLALRVRDTSARDAGLLALWRELRSADAAASGAR